MIRHLNTILLFSSDLVAQCSSLACASSRWLHICRVYVSCYLMCRLWCQVHQDWRGGARVRQVRLVHDAVCARVGGLSKDLGRIRQGSGTSVHIKTLRPSSCVSSRRDLPSRWTHSLGKKRIRHVAMRVLVAFPANLEAMSWTSIRHTRCATSGTRAPTQAKPPHSPRKAAVCCSAAPTRRHAPTSPT